MLGTAGSTQASRTGLQPEKALSTKTHHRGVVGMVVLAGMCFAVNQAMVAAGCDFKRSGQRWRVAMHHRLGSLCRHMRIRPAQLQGLKNEHGNQQNAQHEPDDKALANKSTRCVGKPVGGPGRGSPDILFLTKQQLAVYKTLWFNPT